MSNDQPDGCACLPGQTCHDNEHSDHIRAAGQGATGQADLSGPPDAPLVVEVTRGGMVESRHRGRACIVDADARVLASWGDIESPVFARSAIKALQAIPLVESGALDAFGLGDTELALACSSHNGETRHTRLARSWLEKIGLSAGDLECGAQIPYDDETAHDLIAHHESASTLHNNCSGKHAGFLTTAVHKSEPLKGYTRFDHPVQQRVIGVLEQMTGLDLSSAPWGVDGCSIPTLGIPLGAVAYAMARIGDPKDLPDARAEAVTRIRRSWRAHPHLIGGRGTFDTTLMQAVGGLVLVKSGAEGVGCAVIPKLGIGIALKIEDGAARARDIAMAALIRSTGVVTDDQWTRADRMLTRPIHNRNGLEVGVIRAASNWLGC